MTCEFLRWAFSHGGFSELRDLTGGGKQGFQQAPKPDSFIVEGMGAMGTVQNERKLAYFEVNLSGHMVPQFVPPVRFSLMNPVRTALRETDCSFVFD